MWLRVHHRWVSDPRGLAVRMQHRVGRGAGQLFPARRRADGFERGSREPQRGPQRHAREMPARIRRGRRWLLPLFLLLALGESLFHLPLTSRQAAPAVYGQVAASDGVVLNVPLYHARVERRLMYHQIFHGRPVTNACIPRASDTPHRLIEGTQLRACLLDGDGCARADPAAVAAEIRERQVSWVLVHTRFLEAADADAMDLLLKRAGARERIDDPAEIRAYRF